MAVWATPNDHDGSSPIGPLSPSDQARIIDKLSGYNWGAPTTCRILAMSTFSFGPGYPLYIEVFIHRLTGPDAYTGWYREVQVIAETKELGQEGIDFWKSRIGAYKRLSQEEAVAQLIKARKIEQKIQTIRRAINIPLPE